MAFEHKMRGAGPGAKGGEVTKQRHRARRALQGATARLVERELTDPPVRKVDSTPKTWRGAMDALVELANSWRNPAVA